MNRLGLPREELSVLAAEASRRLGGIRPVLVMSHLACADDPEAAMNARQLARFREALAMLPPAPASLANSGGVLLGTDYAFDMVRPGIGALWRKSASRAGRIPLRWLRFLRGVSCRRGELTRVRALATEPPTGARGRLCSRRLQRDMQTVSCAPLAIGGKAPSAARACRSRAACPWI